MRDLESRYRRLMAVYPLPYRREYEEEMVGVLMAEAAPGQSRPSLRDRADLVINAIAVRVRDVPAGLRDDSWRSAAHAVQVVGAMVLFLICARRLVLSAVIYRAPVEVMDFLRPAVWAVTLTFVLLRHRRLAAVAALAGAATEVVHVAGWYAYSPSQVLMAGWLVIGALLVVATSAWLVSGPPVDQPRRLWAFAVAPLLGAAAGAADILQGGAYFFAGTFEYGVTMDGTFIPRVGAPLYLAAAALAIWAWWKQDGPVRYRMPALLAAPAATALMVHWGFAGFMYSSQRFSTPVYPQGFQWVILAATPPAALALAAVAVGRWERLATLVTLGRRAEHSVIGTPSQQRGWFR